MRFEYDGMVLWYATPDAPAPTGSVSAAPENGQATVSIAVAVQPLSVSNTVEVRYRVNGGSPATINAASQKQDLVRKVQYFSARLPAFQVGDQVDYIAIARSPGRQVPSPNDAATFPSAFSVVAAGAQNPTSGTSGARPGSSGNPSPATGTKASTGPYKVEGHILFEHGLPASSITVRAYNRGFGNTASKLGEVTTDAAGHYALSYSAGAGTVNLEVRAVDAQGKEITLCDTQYGAGPHEVLNLVAPMSIRPLEPEYQRLTADLLVHVGSLDKLGSAREDDEQKDLTLLSVATGWDVSHIELAANAHALTRPAGISPDILYALFRAGLPTDKNQLARESIDAVGQALNAANEADIVKLDSQHIAAAETAFEKFAQSTLVAGSPTGAVSSYSELLSKSGLTPAEQATFARLYFASGNSAEGLWEKALAQGIPKNKISILQLQGKLFYLTLNNASLAAALQQEIGTLDQLAQLVDRDLHEPEQWVARLNKIAGNNEKTLAALIPATYGGDTTADRLDAYAGDLARRVRLSYPTHVIARMVEKGDLHAGDKQAAAPAAVSTFLKNAAQAGFELGTTPVDAVVAHNQTALFTGIKAEDADAVVKHVKMLHRLYQITPSDESLKSLHDIGLTSAHDIATLPHETFLGRYGHLFPSLDEARLVHRKAQQVHSIAFNFFSMAQSLATSPGVFAISPPAQHREASRQNLIKQFPTMEGLFGSLDFCECEDCRSVLSPAAYLVELFQFLDPNRTHWHAFLTNWRGTHNQTPYPFRDHLEEKSYLTDWSKRNPGKPHPRTEKTPYEVFIERRPDLPNLPLTCANTNTVMPYIDIVNEILEYFVVHNALDADSGYDTGEATSPELLAEPENILPLAYDHLKQAKYPLTLPFDLWLETVRRFLNHFDTEFAEVLEVFRPTDDLYAPATSPNVYGRASVFVESLGLSPAEYAIFTDPATLNNWFALYGYGHAGEATAALASAKTLAQKLGVSYRELIDLVTTGFVNPGLNDLIILRKLAVPVEDVFRYEKGPHYTPFSADERATFERQLHLKAAALDAASFDARAWLDKAWHDGDFNRVLVLADPDTGCSFDQTILRHANGSPADAEVFLRVNLFVRLWKKLGWTIEEVDRALQVALPRYSQHLSLAHIGAAFKTALLYLAHLKALDKHLAIGTHGRLKLLTLWANLPTAGKNPLYEQLFLKRSILKDDPVFEDPLGNYLARPDILLKDHLLALQAALNLTAADVGNILADAGQDVSTAALSLDNVSLLYRHGLLAKALKLTVEELISLKGLSGLNPFQALKADPVSVLDDDYPFSQTLRFVEIARIVHEDGFKVEDLDYLLRHRFDPVGKYRQDANTLLTLVKSLAAGLRSIQTDQALPIDPTSLTDDLLQQKLALVLPADAVATFMGMWTGTVQTSAQQPGVPPANQLDANAFKQTPAVSVSYDAVLQAQRLTYTGVLLDAQSTQLQAANPSPLLAALVAGVLAQQKAFYDKYLSAFLQPADYQSVFAPLAPGQTLAAKRQTLLQFFLPFLRQQLNLQFVVQTLATTLSVDPALVQTLLTNPLLLSEPGPGVPGRPLLDAFVPTVEAGVNALFFASADESGAPLPASSQTLAAVDSTNQKPSGANSVHFEGYCQVPSSGPYRFFAQLGKKGAQVALGFDFLPDPLIQDVAASDGAELSAAVDLKAGVTYHFTFDARNLGGGDARLLVQGETLPKDQLSQLTLYTQSSVERTGRAQLLLAKCWQFMQTLALNERELRYLLSNASDFDGLSFSQLPTRFEDDSPAKAMALFKQFLRLADYARLKREIAGGGDDLIGVFENARLNMPAASDPDQATKKMIADLCQRLAQLSRRDLANVQSAVDQLGFRAQSAVSGNVLTVTAADFRQEKGIGRLWHALRLSAKLGVPAETVSRWARPAPDFAIAQDLRNTVKARYAPEAWLALAPSIFDKLRQLRRDALVAWIVQQRGFEDRDQLFEYFLVDPGMEPVVQTSRLRLAISSVQTFVQRCLLNLEAEVQPSALDAEQWQWMKRYRVWQANREIFLFPENWLEPEFRDDKTEPFEELEGTLLQGDITNDLAEDAFFTYLKRLEEIARLEIVTFCCDEKAEDPASNQFHVIGRTHNSPHKYFYRRYAHQMWTPWESVTPQIDGDHVVAVMWRERLNLFWLTFVHQANPDGGDDSQGQGDSQGQDDSQGQSGMKVTDYTLGGLSHAVKSSVVVTKALQVQLNWSEYFQGTWTTPASSGSANPITATVDAGFDNSHVFIHATVEPEDGADVATIHVHFPAAYPPPEHVSMNFPLIGRIEWVVQPPPRPIDLAFRVVSKNSPPEPINGRAPSYPPYPLEGLATTHFGGLIPLLVSYVESVQSSDGRRSKVTRVTRGILQLWGQGAGLSHVLTTCSTPGHADTPEISALVTPFFYQDRQNAFYVEPSLRESTIHGWNHWAIPHPVHSSAASHGGKKHRIVAAVPRHAPRKAHRAGSPAFRGKIAHGARFHIQGTGDH
ncbi:MAG: neuraminidase-like domain-containing protein [Isosphaeraceae bacterium]|jgi:hypothetical protein